MELHIAIDHPLLILALESVIVAATIGLTTPLSKLRATALPVLVICAFQVTSSCPRYIRYSWGTTVSGTSFGLILQYLDKCCINQWSFEDNPFTARRLDLDKSLKKNDSTDIPAGAAERVSRDPARLFGRLKFGFSAAFDNRVLNTAEEVKGCPRFDEKKASWAPSRPYFLLRTALAIAGYWLLMDLVQSQPANDNDRLFAPERTLFFSRLGMMDAEEVVVRIAATTILWGSAYCMIQLWYKAGALIAVATSLSEPQDWRPLFGYVSEAYTMRKFWGSCWHQSLRRPLGEPASFITYRVLRLRKGGIAARYIHLNLVFWESGLLHFLVDLAGGLSLHNSGSMRFFMMQAIGVMMEDCVAYLCRAHRGGQRKDEGTPTWWQRTVGYVWVCGFLLWTTPTWFYPMARITTPDTKGLIPFSLFGSDKSG